MENPFAAKLEPKEIDWPALGIQEWFATESSRYTNAVVLLAKLVVRSGFAQIEPASSLKESWKVLAVKLGVRIYRAWDWDDLWRTVAYLVVNRHETPSAVNLAKEIKRVMIQKNYAPFWNRSKYFIWASRSVEELRRFSQILSLVLARAATDAERNKIDRPSWFKELQALKEAIDGARVPDGKLPALYIKSEGDGGCFSELIEGLGSNHVQVKISEPDGLVYLNKGGFTPNYIRTLALTLLEAADMADKTPVVPTIPTQISHEVKSDAEEK